VNRETPEPSRSRRVLAAWGWTALILALCWLPGPRIPDEENGWKFLDFPYRDKVAHFVMFAGFGILWIRTDPMRRHGWRIAAAGVFLAVVTELGQATPIVQRDASVEDALADLAGLALALAAVHWRLPSRHGPPVSQAES
jgi:VanZ family protein